jgi:hypothetical protein
MPHVLGGGYAPVGLCEHFSGSNIATEVVVPTLPVYQIMVHEMLMEPCQGSLETFSYLIGKEPAVAVPWS